MRQGRRYQFLITNKLCWPQHSRSRNITSTRYQNTSRHEVFQLCVEPLGVNRTNNQANSLLLAMDHTNITNSTCDLGTSAVPFQSVTLLALSCELNDIISNIGAGVADNIAAFSSSKVIKHSGFPLQHWLRTISSVSWWFYVSGSTITQTMVTSPIYR